MRHARNVLGLGLLASLRRLRRDIAFGELLRDAKLPGGALDPLGFLFRPLGNCLLLRPRLGGVQRRKDLLPHARPVHRYLFFRPPVLCRLQRGWRSDVLSLRPPGALLPVLLLRKGVRDEAPLKEASFIGKGFEIHDTVQGFKLGILVEQNCVQPAGEPGDQSIGQGDTILGLES